MKETGFIKQNKEKWEEFEQILNSRQNDPEKLSQLFVQVTDDLSYSRTFYPNRSVRVYLNNIATRVFQNVYKNQRFSLKKLVFFFSEELPYIFWEERKMFRLALLLFFIGNAIGLLSSLYDSNFASAILGNHYVEMTKNYIESGDPMAVYKQDGEMPTFLYILKNNLQVAFLYFVTGLFAGIGSLLSIFRHGIMVGVFQWFFIERGVWKESVFSIWVHGTLEISALIIESAAGFILGRGFLFPGTYTRLQAFVISGRKATKILIATIPLTIVAAVLEGFATRHTEWPYWLRGIIIFGSLFFVLYYFWILPRRKSKSGFAYKPQPVKFQAIDDQAFQFFEIKTNGELIADTILFIRKQARFFFTTLTVLSLAYTLIFTVLMLPRESMQLSSDFFFGNIFIFFRLHEEPLLAIPMMLCLCSLFYILHRKILQQALPKFRPDFKYHLISLSVFVLLLAVLLSVNLISGGWNFVLFILLLPICSLLMFRWASQHQLPKSLKIGFRSLLSRNTGSFLLLYLSFFLMALVIFLFNASFLTLFYTTAIGELLSFSDEVNQNIYKLIFSFLSMFNVMLMMACWFIASGMLYFSMLEKNTSFALREKLQSLGKKNKVQGLEKEMFLPKKSAV